MKNALLIAAALLLVAGSAMAAANAGGGLLIHASPEGLTFCGPAQNAELPGACEDFVTRLDVAGGPPNFMSWLVVAVFPEGSAPELRAAVFGIEFTAVDPPVATNCGDFWIPSPTWPQSGSGVGMTWDYAEYGLITPVIQFESVNYYGDAGYFTIIDHPAQGAPVFGDDSIPTQEDLVVHFGTLGFFQDGHNDCPPPIQEPEPGACCVGEFNEICIIVLEADCDGIWIGEGVPCDPDPCEPVPVLDGSWGSIKATYR